MSDPRLPNVPSDTPVRDVTPARLGRTAVTGTAPGDIARVMPPVEMQQHIQAFVRVGGLPRPAAFHADAGGTLHLEFAVRDVDAVARWARELGMPAPRLNPWGSYLARSAPGAWFGWSVLVRCDVRPAAPEIRWLEYGDRIEARGPAPAGLGRFLGVAFHRHHPSGQDDYLVLLTGDRTGPHVVSDRDSVFQALATGQFPSEDHR